MINRAFGHLVNLDAGGKIFHHDDEIVVVDIKFCCEDAWRLYLDGLSKFCVEKYFSCIITTVDTGLLAHRITGRKLTDNRCWQVTCHCQFKACIVCNLTGADFLPCEI